MGEIAPTRGIPRLISHLHRTEVRGGAHASEQSGALNEQAGALRTATMPQGRWSTLVTH